MACGGGGLQVCLHVDHRYSDKSYVSFRQHQVDDDGATT